MPHHVEFIGSFRILFKHGPCTHYGLIDKKYRSVPRNIAFSNSRLCYFTEPNTNSCSTSQLKWRCFQFTRYKKDLELTRISFVAEVQRYRNIWINFPVFGKQPLYSETVVCVIAWMLIILSTSITVKLIMKRQLFGVNLRGFRPMDLWLCLHYKCEMKLNLLLI